MNRHHTGHAGRSAAAWAAHTRRTRPWWRRLLAALGWWPDREASNRDAGAEGERRTAELLGPLAREGWHILHDRAIPGTRANIDHLLIPPHGRYVITLDSKLWSRHRGTFNVTRSGRLVQGAADRQDMVDTAQWEASCVGVLLGAPAVPVIVMHSAPVAKGMVEAATVPVVAADGLLTLLREYGAARRADHAAADRVARTAARKLPAYR